jgi:hypothetical protein
MVKIRNWKKIHSKITTKIHERFWPKNGKPGRYSKYTKIFEP